MAHQAFVQQIVQHILHAASEVGTETVGKQESSTCGYGTGKYRFWGLCETDRRYGGFRLLPIFRLSSPIGVSGIFHTDIPKITHQGLDTLMQVRLQYFKYFFGHNTITVVVGCTIAGAKVQENYNCYNVYFNECLRRAG